MNDSVDTSAPATQVSTVVASEEPVSYSVDTSALVDLWVRYYSPDIFPGLWKRLEQLVAEGRFQVVDEVRRELERQDDELFKWVKAHPDMVVPLDEELQTAAHAIINGFPSLTNTKSLMSGSADAFVIALAQLRGLTVVMAERSKPSSPRIPDVCRTLGVDYFTPIQMFRKEKFRI